MQNAKHFAIWGVWENALTRKIFESSDAILHQK